MQYESGAKSGNWLAEFVYAVLTSFSILFAYNQFEASRLQLYKIGRVSVNYLVLYFYPCLKSTWKIFIHLNR